MKETPKPHTFIIMTYVQKAFQKTQGSQPQLPLTPTATVTQKRYPHQPSAGPRALSSALPAPGVPGRARRRPGSGRTDQASTGPFPARAAGLGEGPGSHSGSDSPPPPFPQPPPTFSTLRGPLTSSCRLGMVPPSHPISLPAAPRFRLCFPRGTEALPACPERVTAVP